MARAPAREAATIGGVRVALQPPNPFEGTPQPDEGGFFAYHSECADGVVVDMYFDLPSITPTAPPPRAHPSVVRRSAGIVATAWMFAGGSDLLGVTPSDPLEHRLELAAELGVAPSSPAVASVLAASHAEGSDQAIFYLAPAVLAAARERSLTAILALALLAAEPPAEGVDQAIAPRPGAPPGADRTPRLRRVGLTARGRVAAKEAGNAAGLPLLPTEGRQATCAGASGPAA
jgi:hypothetical protein